MPFPKLLIKASNIYQNSKFYGLDIDKSGIEIAIKSIKDIKKEDSIKIYDGSSNVKPNTNGIDIITMVEVFHEISKEIRPIILKMVNLHNGINPIGLGRFQLIRFRSLNYAKH